jgi:hypothetical protein
VCIKWNNIHFIGGVGACYPTTRDGQEGADQHRNSNGWSTYFDTIVFVQHNIYSFVTLHHHSSHLFYKTHTTKQFQNKLLETEFELEKRLLGPRTIISFVPNTRLTGYYCRLQNNEDDNKYPFRGPFWYNIYVVLHR